MAINSLSANPLYSSAAVKLAKLYALSIVFIMVDSDRSFELAEPMD